MRQTRTDFRRYSAQKRALKAHPSRAGMFNIKHPVSVLGTLGSEHEVPVPVPPEAAPPWQTDGCNQFLAEKIAGQCTVPWLAPAENILPTDPAKRAAVERYTFNEVDFGVGRIGNKSDRTAVANAKWLATLSTEDLNREFVKWMGYVKEFRDLAHQYEERYDYAIVTSDAKGAEWAARQIALLQKLARPFAANAVLTRRVMLSRKGIDVEFLGTQGLGGLPLWAAAWGISEAMWGFIVWTGIVTVTTGVAYIGMKKFNAATNPELIALADTKKIFEQNIDCVAMRTEKLGESKKDAVAWCDKAFPPDFDRAHKEAQKQQGLMENITDLMWIVGIGFVGYSLAPLVKEMLQGEAQKRKAAREATSAA